MKLLLLSDLHLAWDRPRARLDEVGKTCFRKMDFVLDFAARNKAVILTAGDFFDKPRSWHMLVAYIRLFDIYDEVLIYTVFGQHDQYFRSRKDTMLEALDAAGYVKVLGGDPVILEHHGARVYGCGYGEEVPDVSGSSGCDILVAHRMILVKSMWPGQEDYEPAGRFLKKHKGYDLILCGDAHQRFEVGLEQADGRRRIICNAGPLFRRSVDLWDHEPGFWIYDTEDWTAEWVEIPHLPPGEVLTRKHLEDAKETKEMLEGFVAAIKAIHPEMEGISHSDTHFQSNLAKFIEENDVSDSVVNIISEEMKGRRDE